MSLLTYNELLELIETGVVLNARPEQVNSASIDVTLGKTIWIENQRGRVVDLANKETIGLDRVIMDENGYLLRPGQFILAETEQIFHLPNDLCFEFKLKSSSARSALGHLLAGHADPGWHGSVLTLEYHNVSERHVLQIRPGMPCGQLVFFRGAPVPEHASYAKRGQYNNDPSAQPSKGLR